MARLRSGLLTKIGRSSPSEPESGSRCLLNGPTKCRPISFRDLDQRALAFNLATHALLNKLRIRFVFDDDCCSKRDSSKKSGGVGRGMEVPEVVFAYAWRQAHAVTTRPVNISGCGATAFDVWVKRRCAHRQYSRDRPFLSPRIRRHSGSVATRDTRAARRRLSVTPLHCANTCCPADGESVGPAGHQELWVRRAHNTRPN